MSYYHCRNGHHDTCSGYVGPLDSYTCLCSCHGEWDERGRRVPLSSFSAADLLAPDDADDEPVRFERPSRPSTVKGQPIPRRGHGASEGDPSL